jgi:cobalt-zinc-cadmium efflux system membrane fusion protein
MISKKFIAVAAICTLVIASFLIGTNYQDRSRIPKEGVLASAQSLPQSQQSPKSQINDADADSQSSGLDWCTEHRVPESVCTLCNPELIEKFKTKGDWCGAHDLPESHCRQCNADIKFAQEEIVAATPADTTAIRPTVAEGDWCAEHRVPESECTRCNPELIEKFKTKGDWCEEHGLPESHDRLCNPDITFSQEPAALDPPERQKDYSIFFPPNKRDCATNDAVIQFTSTETAERCGLTYAAAIEAPVSQYIEAPAEVVFDGTKTSAVTTTVAAAIISWLSEPGQSVSKGQKLAEASSPDIANLEGELIEALAEWTTGQQELARKEKLYKENMINAADYQVAQANARVTEARFVKTRGLLSAAGFSNQDIDALAEAKSISANFALRAPASGVLIERQAKPGQLLSPGESMALISDVSSLWVEAKVGEKDIRDVKIGQSAEFSLDGGSVDRVSGKVIWVAQYLDEITRSGTVRVKLASQDGGIRAHEFGRLFIYSEDNAPKVLIPKDAVQWEGCCNVVFVQETPDRLRPRKVKIGRGDMESYLVYDGLRAGEKVVVSGSYLLKTELMKESIGAGCCEVKPGT